MSLDGYTSARGLGAVLPTETDDLGGLPNRSGRAYTAMARIAELSWLRRILRATQENDAHSGTQEKYFPEMSIGGPVVRRPK